MLQFSETVLPSRVQREPRTLNRSFDSRSSAAYSQYCSRPIWLAVSSTASGDTSAVSGIEYLLTDVVTPLKPCLI